MCVRERESAYVGSVQERVWKERKKPVSGNYALNACVSSRATVYKPEEQFMGSQTELN